MRTLPLLAVIAALAASAGCASSSGGSAPQPTLATSSTLVSTLPSAEVKGHLLRVGGDPSASEVAVRGTVRITGTDGSVTTTEVDDRGDFDILLSPGTYRLTGTSPLIDDGRSVCRTAEPTTVLRAGTAVTADILCSIR